MDIVDIMFHVHPDLSSEKRAKIEESLSASDGVVSVHFSEEQIHELTVAYNPEALNSAAILEQVRNWDAEATMIGL